MNVRLGQVTLDHCVSPPIHPNPVLAMLVGMGRQGDCHVSGGQKLTRAAS